MQNTRMYFLRDLQAALGGETIGEVETPLTGVGTLAGASAAQIAFLANPRYRRALDTTPAGAVIVGPAEREATAKPRIVVDNPYAYFARVAALFAPRRTFMVGIHPSAVVHASAEIGEGAAIGEFVSIGAGARIGAGVRIGPGCTIGAEVTIDDDSELVARVTVCDRCTIGRRALIHPGVVIGADGFGFAREDGRWLKIPQTGRVRIGDDVEVGANTTIDRGAIEDTVIGDGVKIDNQVQIGHNCTIGEHSIIAGCTGIAGSTEIGRRVAIGGAVSITGHLRICDDAVLTANAFVTKSIAAPGMYSSGLPLMPHKDWLRNTALLRRLDKLRSHDEPEGNDHE